MTTAMVQVLSIALVAAVVAVSVAYGVFRRRSIARKRAAFEDVLAHLASWLPLRRLSPNLAQGAGDRAGRPFVAEVSAGSSDLAFGYLRVRLWFDPYARPGREPRIDARGRPLSGPAGMRFRPRTLANRVGAALRLERAPVTGDAVFDRAIEVDSEASDEVLTAFLGEEAARTALLRLIESGARVVDVLHGDATVVATWRNPTKAHTTGVLEAVDLLGAVAASVPVVAGEAVQRGGRVGLAQVPIAWGAIGLMGSVWALLMEGYHPLVHFDGKLTLAGLGLLFGLAGCALSYRLCYRKNRGTAHLAISVPAAFFAGIGALLASGLWLNRALDRAPATPHESRVMETTTVSRRGSNDEHSVSLKSWRPGGLPIHVDLEASDASMFRAGDPVIARSRPGYFGWEWVASLESPPRIDPPPRPPDDPPPAPEGP